jgi:7-cyano-7-deazaguanine synthase
VRTLVLLSGGLDSTVVLAACVAQGDECLAVGFDYNQDHHIELDHAEDIAAHFAVPFERVGLPAMFNAKVDDVVFAGRNLILAALAIGMAQADTFDRIAVGCNASDWARFPDCRPEFWRNLDYCASAYGVKVVTPLIYMSKRDVVETARKLKVPIELTWSCYSPQDGHPCGECLACTTRQEALK